jgi:TnpA family transposase
LAGSLKLGWVTASPLIGKLHAMPKQNALVRSLQEYGRLVKTNFILRYLSSDEYRRQISQQLNKGEALHALRRYLFVANEGQIRKRHQEDQLRSTQSGGMPQPRDECRDRVEYRVYVGSHCTVETRRPPDRGG